MNAERSRTLAAAGLVIGALLGIAGALAPSAGLRGLAWGIDGIAIVVASASPLMPAFLRITGAAASVLLAITALRIFGSTALTPLSKPLPFFAYPFLAITLIGWAWVHARTRLVQGGRAG